MPDIEETIVINQPRKVVFDFFVDPDNVAVYSSNVVDYEVTSGGRTEVGRTAKFSVKVVGVKLDYTDELVEITEGESSRLESRKGPISYAINMSFADEGEGTKVTWRQEIGSMGSVFRFADGVVLKMYGRDVRSNLEKAKTLLES